MESHETNIICQLPYGSREDSAHMCVHVCACMGVRKRV